MHTQHAHMSISRAHVCMHVSLCIHVTGRSVAMYTHRMDNSEYVCMCEKLCKSAHLQALLCQAYWGWNSEILGRRYLLPTAQPSALSLL